MGPKDQTFVVCGMQNVDVKHSGWMAKPGKQKQKTSQVCYLLLVRATKTNKPPQNNHPQGTMISRKGSLTETEAARAPTDPGSSLKSLKLEAKYFGSPSVSD